MHLVEIGITRDTRYLDTLREKGTQHDRTEQGIQDAGWTTKQHTLIFGRAGTVYTNACKTLKTLGMDTDMANKLINQKQMYLCNSLLATYKTRRHLDYTKAATIPTTGGPKVSPHCL